jgi:hypothetical protein
MSFALTADRLDRTTTTTTTTGAQWTGRVLSGLAIAFLAFDTALKVFMLAPATQGTSQLGWPVSAVPVIGALELLCLIAYVVPRTSLVGAVLFTGYLGGAIATHLRIGSPLFSHTLFPIYVAALLWGGLYLRDGRVRALLAPRGRA